jgi:Icc-related predicted phosphoesterase
MKSINKTMIEHVIKIANEIKADALLVCVDVINDITALPEEIKKAIGFIFIARENEKIAQR